MPLPAIKPFSIKVFFADGEPRGCDWQRNQAGTGLVPFVPDNALAKSKIVENSADLAYLLLGDDAGQNLPDVYIDEADPLVDRITHHVQNKDFWERFVAFSDRGQHLTKRTSSTWSTE
jgi:hypothetical protein